MNFRCIFFDFDGVLIKNSQILFLEVMKEYLSKKGLDLQLSYYVDNFLGWKGEQISEQIKSSYQFEMMADDLKEIRTFYKSSLIAQPEVDPSIYKTLEDIQNCYICSSNNKPFINQILIKTNLKQYFSDDNIFSLENTEKVKPDPMVYLNALKHSNLAKEECCAIEDSVAGAIAAKNAGLYTFGYTGSLSGSLKENYIKSLQLAGIDRIINAFSEI